MLNLDDLDEQAEYLIRLTKSANPLMAEQARDALDRLATVDLEKVGPKGYIHGWVFVGNRGVGSRIEHPEHGHGTVTRSGSRTVGVRFDSGKEHAFEHGEPGNGHFTARAGNRSAPAPKPKPTKTAPPKPKPVKAAPKPKPVKAAPAKAKPSSQQHQDFAHRSVGKDLIGSNPAKLAQQVIAKRDKQRAADHGLAVIGHEQGFDAKPKVVSKEEMDRLVAAGHTETFRGVMQRPDGPSPAEIHEEMRSGHAYYGNGIYGNGYYWGYPDIAKDYSDGSHGSVARAVISPDAKIGDFWESLDKEHTDFLNGIEDRDLLEVYGDIGRYAAARGYDVIRINQKNAPPFYNILNRSALVVEEAK